MFASRNNRRNASKKENPPMNSLMALSFKTPLPLQIEMKSLGTECDLVVRVSKIVAWDEDEQAGEASRSKEDPEHSRERSLQEQLLDIWFMNLHELECLILAVAEECQEWIKLVLPAGVTVGVEEERNDQLQNGELASACMSP